MINKLERLKKHLINIWATYDLPVGTEAGLSRRPGVFMLHQYELKMEAIKMSETSTSAQSLIYTTPSSSNCIHISTKPLGIILQINSDCSVKIALL
jgi:hypothetical protein